MAETERVFTRVTLFVPGAPASVAAWTSALRPQGLVLEDGLLRGDSLQAKVSVRWVDNDGGFGEAFSFGTVSPEVVRTIDKAPGALVLEWTVDLKEGKAQMLGVVERLREAGAIGVRLEESKLGWDVSRWLELFSSENPWDWHKGAILFLASEDAVQSCGMHAFSLPDARVTLNGEDAGELQELASVLNVYQIDEDPVLLSGQTFSPDAETPRRVVQRWPDTGYPRDHPCHNPYGVWRLGPPGGKGESLPELAPVFVPALCAVLMAAERKEGKPLTRAQVESIRDKGACIMMPRRVAQTMERSRGYADIDPELVWEQWELMRENARADGD